LVRGRDRRGRGGPDRPAPWGPQPRCCIMGGLRKPGPSRLDSRALRQAHLRL